LSAHRRLQSVKFGLSAARPDRRLPGACGAEARDTNTCSDDTTCAGYCSLACGAGGGGMSAMHGRGREKTGRIMRARRRLGWHRARWPFTGERGPT
jgi:hypothetical protein